jgi:hypothetical protein
MPAIPLAELQVGQTYHLICSSQWGVFHSVQTFDGMDPNPGEGTGPRPKFRTAEGGATMNPRYLTYYLPGDPDIPPSSDHPAPVPAPVPSLSARNADTTECAICLEDLSKESGAITIVETLPPTADGKIQCGHKFHKTCIETALALKQVCPVCRGVVLKTYPGFPNQGGSRKRKQKSKSKRKSKRNHRRSRKH